MTSTPETSITRCRTCVTPIGFINCPTGGWWAHEQHPADEHDAIPGAWQDGDELMEAIAAAVWEHCHTEGTSDVVDDPRNIAGTAAAVARRMLAAVLPAVPVPPTTHATVRAEAANYVTVDELAHAIDNSTPYPIEIRSDVCRFMAERLLEMLTVGKRDEHPVWQPEEEPPPSPQPRPEDPAELRRLADEAQQQPDTETCRRTRSVDGTEYPPCARKAGHEEAYCQSADGRAYFLAALGPGRVADEEA
jgi:hypothetical protein